MRLSRPDFRAILSHCFEYVGPPQEGFQCGVTAALQSPEAA